REPAAVRRLPEAHRGTGTLPHAARPGAGTGGSLRREARGPVKVALFVHRFPPREVGGTELYARALAGELKRQGAQCAVLAARHAPVAVPTLDAGREDGIL